MKYQKRLRRSTGKIESRMLAFLSFLCISWVGLRITTFAQESAPEENTELADLMAQAREYELRTTNPDEPLQLRESSVLNFTNPERNQERGSVLVWMQDDRPAVIGQFFRYNSRNGRTTKHAFHSLTSRPLEATVDGKVVWAPHQPGIVWKTFADPPMVADKRTARLLQIRQLIRTISVSLFAAQGKSTELRLSPRPLLEYSAPKSGVIDGVIFSYVVATDPEAILLVEAFEESGKSSFRYAFARFHFRRLIAKDGDREVWSVEDDFEMVENRGGDPETMKRAYNSFKP